MSQEEKKRREHVPFDPRHFERSGGRPIGETFREIYRTNHWAGRDSVSGDGASRAQTRAVEVALPPLLRELGLEVLLDLPCGDFSWMRHVDLPVSRYLGADVVPELVEANRQRYGTERRRFEVLDLAADPLPEADLILCRDCLVHLSFADAARALGNVRRSSIRFLLATTFPGTEVNEDITTGDWRPLNLQRPPFDFPEPLRLIDERCTEGGGRFADKSLGLWLVDTLAFPDDAAILQ